MYHKEEHTKQAINIKHILSEAFLNLLSWILKLPSLTLFMPAHHWVTLQFILLAFCFSPSVTLTVSLTVALHFIVFSSAFLSFFFFFCLVSPCGQGAGSEPSREERPPSTQTNICPALNWANMDKAKAIPASVPVPGRLPCCPIIHFPSVLQSWLLVNPVRRLFKQITGWWINLIIPFWSFSISVHFMRNTCAILSNRTATNHMFVKLQMFTAALGTFKTPLQQRLNGDFTFEATVVSVLPSDFVLSWTNLGTLNTLIPPCVPDHLHPWAPFMESEVLQPFHQNPLLSALINIIRTW